MKVSGGICSDTFKRRLDYSFTVLKKQLFTTFINKALECKVNLKFVCIS